MIYEVLISEPARHDVREAFEWWRDNRSPDEAERWYNEILPAISTLSDHPESCPLAPETDLMPTGLRQLHFGIGRRTTHRIVFTIDGNQVVILRVRHVARRDLTDAELE